MLQTPSSRVAGALTALALTLGTAGSAVGATDFASMSAEERAAFREEVRAFLMEEPEIITEALRELERRRVADALDTLNETIAAGQRVVDFTPPDADLTLIEFTDYNCPYCRRAHPEVEAFVAADKRIHHVVKALPYIGSDVAERAILAAQLQTDQDVVTKYHQALMTSGARLADEQVFTIADDLGLDVAQLQKDMSDPRVESQLSRTLQIARALQIDGTPAFVFEGQVLGGLRSKEELASIATMLRAEKAN